MTIPQRTPSVLELQNRHKTTVHGAGQTVLDHADQVIGVTWAARHKLVPLGKGRIIVLLPETTPVYARRGTFLQPIVVAKQRVSSITMLALGLIRTAEGLKYVVQQDYDLWKRPQSGTTEPGVMDPRWPVFNAKTGRKAQGRGDVLTQSLDLWSEMANQCRRISASEVVATREKSVVADDADLFNLPVIPELPTIMVMMRDEPGMPVTFSSQWSAWYTHVDREKMFASHIVSPQDPENTTGLWLAPVGAYSECPTGQLFELYNSMPQFQVLGRAGASHELVFTRQYDFSGIELDLTQRKFSKVPKASPLSLGGVTLQEEHSPSEPLQAPSST